MIKTFQNALLDILPGPKGEVPLLSEDSPLAALIDLGIMQRILLNFSRIIGVSAGVIDLDGKVLAASPWQRLCTGYHRTNPKTCARCIESDTSLALSMQQGSKVAIYNCQNGLTDAAAPIVVGGRHLANLFTGQFLRAQPDVEFFLRQAKEFGFDKAGYLAALKEVPIVPEEKIASILDFMDAFAQLIISPAEEKLRVQDEIRKNLEQQRLLIQQSKLAAMGEMIGAIAHQWRQPLNAISMIIADVKDAYDYGELDKKYIADAAEKTKAQINHMSVTIEDFRNFFKPSKEKLIFRLNTAIGEVMYLIYDQLMKANIGISINCKYDSRIIPGNRYPEIISCEPEIPVYGYPNEFKQAFLSIIGNARDAIGNKKRQGKFGEGEIGQIHIEMSKTDDTAILKIRDNGTGIPAEIMETIFDPYFTTKEGEGTGIGLYMSKVIIESHMGGSIQVSNVESGTGTDGALFTIKLPVGTANDIGNTGKLDIG